MHNKVIRNLFIIIFFVVIIALVLFLIQTKNKKHGDSSLLEVKSTHNDEIIISDSFPMSDDMGKKIDNDSSNSKVQGYYEFEIKSNNKVGTNFEIIASDLDFNNDIHPNYIKMYLTDEMENPLAGYDELAVPTFYKLKVSSMVPTGRRVYYGYIKPGEVKKYKLRVWVGDAYSVGVNTKNFGMKISVEAD